MTTTPVADTRTRTRLIRNLAIRLGDALDAWDRHTTNRPTIHPADALTNLITAARYTITGLGSNPDDAVEQACRKAAHRIGIAPAGLELTAQRVATWLDGANHPGDEELDMRVGKIIEEVGEVSAAWTAYLQQNPRKPAGPLADVVAELGDVILTAAVAITSIETAHLTTSSTTSERV